MGERDKKCFARRTRALPVPLSTSSRCMDEQINQAEIRCPLTLKEEWQERNEKHKENTDDTPSDPVEYGDEVVATLLSSQKISLRVVLANGKFLIQSAKEDD